MEKRKEKTKIEFVIDTNILKQETKHKESILRKYDQGKISISRAAEETGLTVGEIEEYIVGKGYRSKYSTVDLERELELLKS
jgi:predicted HTH domain antitoxin